MDELWAEVHELRKQYVAKLDSIRNRLQEHQKNADSAAINSALTVIECDHEHKFRQVLMVTFFLNAYTYHGPCTNVRERRLREEVHRGLEQLRVQRAMLGGLSGSYSDIPGADAFIEEDPAIAAVEELCAPKALQEPPSLAALSRKRVSSTETTQSFKVRATEAGRLLHASRVVARRGVPRGYPDVDGELAPTIDYEPAARVAPLGTAKTITRTELLAQINGFFALCNQKPVNRCDRIWTDWFIPQYLGLSPTDKDSSRPLMVSDRPAPASPAQLLQFVKHAIREQQVASGDTASIASERAPTTSSSCV